MSTSRVPPLLTACSQIRLLLCLPASLVSVTHISTSLFFSLGGNPYLTSSPSISPTSAGTSPAPHFLLQIGPCYSLDMMVSCHRSCHRAGSVSQSCQLSPIGLHGRTHRTAQGSTSRQLPPKWYIKTQQPMDQPWRYSDPNWPPCSWSPCSRRAFH